MKYTDDELIELFNSVKCVINVDNMKISFVDINKHIRPFITKRIKRNELDSIVFKIGKVLEQDLILVSGWDYELHNPVIELIIKSEINRIMCWFEETYDCYDWVLTEAGRNDCLTFNIRDINSITMLKLVYRCEEE